MWGAWTEKTFRPRVKRSVNFAIVFLLDDMKRTGRWIISSIIKRLSPGWEKNCVIFTNVDPCQDLHMSWGGDGISSILLFILKFYVYQRKHKAFATVTQGKFVFEQYDQRRRGVRFAIGRYRVGKMSRISGNCPAFKLNNIKFQNRWVISVGGTKTNCL